MDFVSDYQRVKNTRIPITASQDVHAFTQQSSSILLITPHKLKLETSALQFKNVYE